MVVLLWYITILKCWHIFCKSVDTFFCKCKWADKRSEANKHHAEKLRPEFTFFSLCQSTTTHPIFFWLVQLENINVEHKWLPFFFINPWAFLIASVLSAELAFLPTQTQSPNAPLSIIKESLDWRSDCSKGPPMIKKDMSLWTFQAKHRQSTLTFNLSNS